MSIIRNLLIQNPHVCIQENLIKMNVKNSTNTWGRDNPSCIRINVQTLLEGAQHQPTVWQRHCNVPCWENLVEIHTLECARNLPSSVLGKAILKVVSCWIYFIMQRRMLRKIAYFGVLLIAMHCRAGCWNICPCCRNLLLVKPSHAEENCQMEHNGNGKSLLPAVCLIMLWNDKA